MKAIVKGVNVEVTGAMSVHVEEQMANSFQKFENVIVEDVLVTLTVNEHHACKNSVTVRVPIAGNDVVVTEEGDDMYGVISGALDKAARSLRKKKERVQSHKGLDKRAVEYDPDIHNGFDREVVTMADADSGSDD